MNKAKCANCSIMKEETEFYRKDKTTGRLGSWCKNCTLSLQKKRWKDRKVKIVELLGGQCERCGYDKNYAALDLHHINPDDKEYLLRDVIRRPWNVVIAEIRKCELICKNCHSEHHHPQWNKHDIEQPTQHAKHLEHKRPIYVNTSECPVCKKPSYGTTYCSNQCAQFSRRKVKARPTKEELSEMAKHMSICAIGRQFGVSDNAIRKWMK